MRISCAVFMFCIVISVLLSGDLSAQTKSITFKAGLDAASNFDKQEFLIVNDISMDMNNISSFGIEIIFKKFEMPTVPEIGIGADYLLPRKVKNGTFWFLPVYGIARIQILSHKDFSVTKAVLKVGYNRFNENLPRPSYEHLPSFVENFSGDVYFSYGIDHIIREKFLIGLHLSKHGWKNELTPRPGHEEYFTPKTNHYYYDRITFCFGYLYQ